MQCSENIDCGPLGCESLMAEMTSTLKMEATYSSQVLVIIHKTTQPHNPGDHDKPAEFKCYQAFTLCQLVDQLITYPYVILYQRVTYSFICVCTAPIGYTDINIFRTKITET
jgi:hypothetical protein